MTIINNRSFMFSCSIRPDKLIRGSELEEQGWRPHFISLPTTGKGHRGDKRKSLGFGAWGCKEFSLAQVQREYLSTFGRSSRFLQQEGEIGVRFCAKLPCPAVGSQHGEGRGVWSGGSQGHPDESHGDRGRSTEADGI